MVAPLTFSSVPALWAMTATVAHLANAPVDAPSMHMSVERIPITVQIPTFNESAQIAKVLASVCEWADDVLVVDSYSTDDTARIAESMGARVLQHEYLNYATQNNWGLQHCRHDWVLVVDADERVTPALAEEIRGLMCQQGGPPCTAYTIHRDNTVFGSRIRFSGWQHDQVNRFFDRRHTRFRDLEVHAGTETTGTIGHLAGHLEHYPYPHLDDYFEKFRRYTTWSANDAWKRGRRARWWHLLFRPGLEFLRKYILSQGFRDGVPGLVLCLLSAFYQYTRFAKLWAMEQAVLHNRRYPNGRYIIHKGAAILEEREIIAGGKQGLLREVSQQPQPPR